jgi:hypothetical protein
MLNVELVLELLDSLSVYVARLKTLKPASLDVWKDDVDYLRREAHPPS